jgi:hypothetical protein
MKKPIKPKNQVSSSFMEEGKSEDSVPVFKKQLSIHE